MTKKQALNYLKSSGFSKEQIQAIVKALSGSEIPTDSDNLSSGTRKTSKKLEKGTTKNDLGVEKIIDEIEKEFEKVDIPIMDKLTLFAKTQNALYRCADMREVRE